MSPRGLFLSLTTCMTLIKIYMTPKKQSLWFHVLMRPGFLSSWFQRACFHSAAWTLSKCSVAFRAVFSDWIQLFQLCEQQRKCSTTTYVAAPYVRLLECAFFRASHRKAFALFEASKPHTNQNDYRWALIWGGPAWGMLNAFEWCSGNLFWEAVCFFLFVTWCPTHPLKEGLDPHQWYI